MEALRMLLTGAWAEAHQKNQVRDRTLIFGGSVSDLFVYLQVDGVVYRFAISNSLDSLRNPSIAKVLSFGSGEVLFEIDEAYKLLVQWWQMGLKAYLIKVRDVGNATYLPEIAKDYLLLDF